MSRYFGPLAEALELLVPQFFLITTDEQYTAKVATLRGGHGFGIDFTAYDKAENAVLNRATLSLLGEFVAIPPAVLSFILDSVTTPVVVLPDGDCYMPYGSNPSGQFLTSLMNTVNHLVMNTEVFAQVLDFDRDGYLAGREAIRSVMTGDDGIESAVSSAEALRAMALIPSAYQELFGIGAKVDAVTSADGSPVPYPSGVLPPYLSRVEIQVAGRHVLVPYRPHRVLAGLQFETTHDLNDPSYAEVRRQKVSSALLELSGFRVAQMLDPVNRTPLLPACVLSLERMAARLGVALPSIMDCLWAHVVDDAPLQQQSSLVQKETDMPRRIRIKTPVTRRTSSKTSTSSAKATRRRSDASSRARNGHPPAQVLAVSEPHSLVPPPKVHQRIVTTISKEGLSRAEASQDTIRLDALIVSSLDRFHVALLQSLFVPAQPFPLPGIHLYGIPNALQFGDTASPNGVQWGSPPTREGIFNPTIEVRGSTINRAVGEGTVAVARYGRFSGKTATTVETTTDSNGMAEIWFFADPTDLVNPVRVIKVSNSMSNYTDLVVIQSLEWQANPYPYTKAYVPEAGDNPCTETEYHNVYYTGAAALMVTTLNANAFLSTAYQVRNGDNVPDRFNDELGALWTTPEPAANLGMSDTPTTGQGALSLYTGASWHAGTRSVPSESGAALSFAVSGSFRRCWAMGAPFVRVIVRTQSNGIPAAGPVQFNVRFNCWAGTAPQDLSLAASQPFETVPFESPSWLRVVKTRGAVFPSAKMEIQYGEMVRSMAMRIPEGMVGATPLERSLISSPAATMKHVLRAPVSEVQNQPSWFDKTLGVVDRGISAVRGFTSTVAPVVSYVTKLLG